FQFKYLNNLKNYNISAKNLLCKNGSIFNFRNRKHIGVFRFCLPNYENYYSKRKLSFDTKSLWLNKSLDYNLQYFDCQQYATCSSAKCLFKYLPLKALSAIRTLKSCSAFQQKETHFTSQSHFKTITRKDKILWDSKVIIDNLEEKRAIVKEKVDDIIERENIWTIPNLLCVGRIVVSPFLCYSVLSSHYTLAFGMFIVAGFTDLIDGMIARKFPSQASRLGSFLDPLADKILVSSLFLTLTYMGLIPFILTGIIVYRDVVIIAGASYIRYKSLPPPHTLSRYFDASHATAQLNPTFISKLNTAIQLALITSSLGAPVFAYTDHYLLQFLWFVTGLTTLTSGISYIFSKETFVILSSTSKKT
ncbi:putative cardiolipin synthase (CMP-forming), partial [Armadillidium nasatum]